jgi:putative transposase
MGSRQECLNEHDFINLTQARDEIRKWHRFYNYEREHGAIGNATPISFLQAYENDHSSLEKSQ